MNEIMNEINKLKDNLPVYASGIFIYGNNKQVLCSCSSEQYAIILCNIINSFFNNTAIFKNLIVSSIQLYEAIANAKIEINTREKAILQHAYLDFEKHIKEFLKIKNI